MGGLDWHDLKLFVAVAEAQALNVAARKSSSSAATLGRRMHSLEETIGQRLFVRGKQGYTLTPAGIDLLTHAREVDAAMNRLEIWRAGSVSKPSVRISTGTWISHFLANNATELVRDTDEWCLEFHTTSLRLDIARREADIGIRNRRPEQAWLAGRLLGKIRFASYSLLGSKQVTNWIGLTGDASNMPSAIWLDEHHGAEIGVRVTDPRLVLDLVRKGVGMAVLPCFIGDRYPESLQRLQIIEALDTEQWLVTHQDTRQLPSIRATADRIIKLVGSHRAQFAGSGNNDTHLSKGEVSSPSQ